MTFLNKSKLIIPFEIFIMIVGCLITAFALNMIIIPAHLLSGGVTGIAQIINHFVSINIGTFYFVLNIPLMILGYKHLGKKFSLYTILSITFLSLSLHMIPIRHIWTSNTLLSGIFGGFISSIGGCLVLRIGGSQGGLDILSRVIAKYRNISVGKAGLMVNVVIVFICSYIFNAELALYTIVSMFTTMKTYEIALNHVDRISVLIVSEKGEAINQAITSSLYRGITMWDANGGFTHNNKTVLFCVLVRGQMQEFQQIVKSVDEDAFVTIISTQNVIGNFHQIW